MHASEYVFLLISLAFPEIRKGLRISNDLQLTFFFPGYTSTSQNLTFFIARYTHPRFPAFVTGFDSSNCRLQSTILDTFIDSSRIDHLFDPQPSASHHDQSLKHIRETRRGNRVALLDKSSSIHKKRIARRYPFNVPPPW